MPSIETLKERVATYEHKVAEVEPFVPDRLKAKAQAARETLEQAESDAVVDLKDLRARYAARISEYDAARDEHLALMQTMLDSTEKLALAYEAASAAERLLRRAGEPAQRPLRLHAIQDYDTRTLVRAYQAATQRPV
jgi:hypothetical protein